MSDIGRLAGVSAMTVSRVLRRPDAVSEAIRQRVLQIVKDLDYVPNVAAHGLSSQRSGFVAALVPVMDSSNFADTARGLNDVLEKNGLQLLLGFTEYSLHREEQIITTMLLRRPEAIALIGGHHTERARRMLDRAGTVVVEMWELPSAPIEHVVGFSNFEAARAMVRHLFDRGYRNIGFVGGATTRDKRGTLRRAGYSAAVEELGLPRGRVVTYGTPPISTTQGGEAFARLLARHPDIDAVMAVSDLSAFGVLSECQRRGLAVPDRMAVAGFGDFEIAATCHPRLTTVNVDSYGIGRRTGELIVDVLDAKQAGAAVSARTVTNDFTIIQRETT
ncbi:MAG: LacI family DNA-binding transcriptional regulator [Pseudomonadota bacterium]